MAFPVLISAVRLPPTSGVMVIPCIIFAPSMLLFMAVALAMGVALAIGVVLVAGVVLVVGFPLFIPCWAVFAGGVWVVVPPHAASKTANSTIIANDPECRSACIRCYPPKIITIYDCLFCHIIFVKIDHHVIILTLRCLFITDVPRIASAHALLV